MRIHIYTYVSILILVVAWQLGTATADKRMLRRVVEGRRMEFQRPVAGGNIRLHVPVCTSIRVYECTSINSVCGIRIRFRSRFSFIRHLLVAHERYFTKTDRTSRAGRKNRHIFDAIPLFVAGRLL